MNNKGIIIIIMTALLAGTQFIGGGLRHVSASGMQGRATDETISLHVRKANSRINEGLLDVPDSYKRKAVLCEWITDAVSQYCEEKDIRETFYYDYEESIMSGDTNFYFMDMGEKEWYEYAIDHSIPECIEGWVYKFRIQGENSLIYMEVNVPEERIYIYPSEASALNVVDNKGGSSKAYSRVEFHEEGGVSYYPDDYVENDWDDMLVEDDRFVGVTIDELEELDFFRAPDRILSDETPPWDKQFYANVASILKKYVDENAIEDTFYFDSEKDIICRVTNMIFTCRIRGETMTLHMEIDNANMQAHVYRVEE